MSTTLDKPKPYKKSNELVQKFKHELSLKELKLVNYMIANIGNQKYDKEFNTLVFDANEFYSALGIERKLGGKDYSEIEDIIYKLYKRDSGWVNVYEKRTILKWIEKPTIDPTTNKVILKLDDDLKPYLLELDKGYFMSEYEYTRQMTSKYSLRLYELLKSWEKVKHGKKEFEVDELKILIDATSDSLSNFAEFKRTALDKAIKEINAVTDLYVEYEVSGRLRRKVTKLLFTFRKKTDDFIDAEFEEVELTSLEELYQYIDVKTDKDKNILEELINIYVDAVGGDDNETFKDAYIKRKMIDIKLADNIKTNKHAYLLGIIRNDIKNATATKKPVRNEIIPEWFKNRDKKEEFKEANQEEIDTFKKKLEELEEPFEVRKAKLQAELKRKYGKDENND